MMASRRRRVDELSSRRQRRFGPALLIVLILATIGLAAYWYLEPRGMPGWVQNYFPNQGPARLYKWRDAEGQVQYSNQPPPAGIDYQLVDYWEDANVIPAQPRED
ncbi:MAG: DUF4124 domain-containing protein [Candidatus Competibacterales bacterium]|nr:DUF4124 domain-containing protein [Candidatus Competibacterales bacterium]